MEIVTRLINRSPGDACSSSSIQLVQWRSRYTAAALIGVIAWTLLVALPGAWWPPDKYSAWATGLSTIAVVLALALAVVTLRTDVKDRQVDRTLALHAELTSGEINDARLRLADHLRKNGTRNPSDHRMPMRVSIEELHSSRGIGTYGPKIQSNPKDDLSKILRYFERVRLVRDARSADDPLFVELIGRHAGWWNCVLVRDSSRGSRRALMQLGLWCDAFADKNKRHYSYLAGWGDTRISDFGSMNPWQNDPP
jgi:hypothetical protein